MKTLSNTAKNAIRTILDIHDSATVGKNQEFTQALQYLKHLELDGENSDSLEKAIRFFRIRPEVLNTTPSPIADVYTLLKNEKILPSTPLTPEETLLSEFIMLLSQEDSCLNDESDDVLIYQKLVDNIDPDIESLLDLAISLADCISVDIINKLKDGKVKPLSAEKQKKLIDMLKKDISNGESALTEVLLSIKTLELVAIDIPNNKSLLTHAAIQGNLTVTKMLLDNGAIAHQKVDDGDCALAHVASLFTDAQKPNHAAIAKLLLERMSTELINQEQPGDDLSILEYSIINKHTAVTIELLACEKVNIYIPFYFHSNALIAAAKNGLTDVVEKIVLRDKEKRLINATDDRNNHALHYAAIDGYQRMTAILLENGANPNKVENKYSNTLLSLIAGRDSKDQKPEHFAITRLLLQYMSHKAIQAITQDGMTALEWAVFKNNPNIVLPLLKFTLSNGLEFDRWKIHAEATRLNWTDVINVLATSPAQININEANDAITHLRKKIKMLEEDNQALKAHGSTSSSVAIPITPLRAAGGGESSNPTRQLRSSNN